MEAECVKKYSDARQGKVTACLPTKPYSRADILSKVEDFTSGMKKHYANGFKTCGAVFTTDDSHWAFISDVMK